MYARKLFSTTLLIVLLAVAIAATRQESRAQTGGPDSPVPNVIWQVMDSISACPGGDSVVAGHPSRLRVLVSYTGTDIDSPRVNVPPESIWVTYSTEFGSIKVNDKRDNVLAEDYTNASGEARITIPSLSGSGTLRLSLYVSGTAEGYKDVHIESTDVDADRLTTTSDSTAGTDMDWSGSVTQADRDTIGHHLEHGHRNALHGGMVQVTDLCNDCGGSQPNTRGGSKLFWSPSGRMLSYTSFVATSGDPACKVFISRSDSLKGRRLQVTSVPVLLHDYDPSWSPLDDVLVFDRADKDIIRRGLPWTGDTSEVALTNNTECGNEDEGDITPAISPDGQWVAISRCGPYPPGGWSIWKVRIDGTGIKQLTPRAAQADHYPSWSPDGQWIFFQRGRLNAEWDVCKVPADSGAVSLVSPDSGAVDTIDSVQPVMSPDGKILVFGRGLRDRIVRNVFAHTMDPSVAPITARRPVANYRDTTYAELSDFPVLSPTLSPDGTRLALGSKQVWAARRNMNLPPQIIDLFVSCAMYPDIEDTTALVDISMRRGYSNTVEVLATDPEGDALTYAASFLPSGATFNTSTHELTWNPSDSIPYETKFYVTFRVTTASGGTDALVAALEVVSTCVFSSPMSQRAVLEEARELKVGPNPTRGRFVFPAPAGSGKYVVAAVYDLAGRRVTVVRALSGSPLLWDGRDAAGLQVQPGIYLYRIEAGRARQEGKVVVVR